MENTFNNLGRFVRIRERADGTHRAFFEVPAQLRPDGWPASVCLPEIGQRIGQITDPKFRELVVADAARLNQRLDLRRETSALRHASDKSLPRLAEIYFRRDVYTSLSESRMYRNKLSIQKILEWSASRGHPDVAALSALDVDDFLSIYCTRVSRRFDMRSVWSMLFKTAIYAGWIKESPLPKGNWNRPQPRQVAVWKQEDVGRYAAMAAQMKQPGLAALIVAMMEIGQRCGDMRSAKWGKEYLGDRFIIRQSKTEKIVNIPVPEQLRNLISSVRVPSSPFVFNNFDTKTGFTSAQLTLRFAEVRHALAEEGEDALHLRGLRHACICRLMGAGLSTSEIAGITGHLLGHVHAILERYYPDRWGMAERGMRRAFAAAGNAPDTFGDLKPLRAFDWEGDPTSPATYHEPQFTESNVEWLLAVRSGQHRIGAVTEAIESWRLAKPPELLLT